MVPVGLVSYSIYLWHYPLIKIVHRGFTALFNVPSSLFWQFAVYFPLTVLCVGPLVVASYILFEKQAMEWLRNWRRAKGRRSRSSAETAV